MAGITNIKILYAGMKFDYGKPNRGLSFEHYNFYNTLKHMGFDIVYFDCMTILQKVGRKKMNQKLFEVVSDEKPDLLFCVLMENEFDHKTIRRISNETTTTTYNWFCDDHWRYEHFSKNWTPNFNWVSTTDAESYHKYHADGFKNVIKTQWGVNNFLYKKKDLPFKYDVSFVGQVHSNRKKVINSLEKRGIKVQCFGADWPNGRVTQEEMINIFNQSKINLNLNNSSTNKWYRFWKRDRNQIKGRNFEVPGSGGFLLTNLVDHLDDYFDLVTEIGIYESEETMAERIRYYLANEDERKKIAEAGYNRCVKSHSYVSRFSDIFETIFS